MAITPYHQEINLAGESFCSPEMVPNYTPYDIFCLTTQLTSRWKGIGIPRLRLEKRGVFMVMTSYLVSLGDNIEITLTTELRESLQKLVDDIIEYSSEYVILLNINNIDLPQSWTSMILPYIQLPTEYQSYIEDNYVYVNLSKVSGMELLDRKNREIEGTTLIDDTPLSYNEEYHRLLDMLIKRLKELYEQGGIVTNAQFAKNWDLQLINSDSKNEDIGLYTAKWKDSRFAPELVNFLLSQSIGNNDIHIKINKNYLSKHYIAETLENKIKYKFSEEYIILSDVKSLEEIRTWTSIILQRDLEANVENSTLIRFIPLISLDDPTIQKEEAIKKVIYPTDDYLFPYTLSILV